MLKSKWEYYHCFYINKTDYIFGILNFDYVEPFKTTFAKKEEV